MRRDEKEAVQEFARIIENKDVNGIAVEKFLEEARSVEIDILADKHGNRVCKNNYPIVLLLLRTV